MIEVPHVESVADLDVGGRSVLVRTDMNSPIERTTGRIVDDWRIQKSAPTLRDLAERGARVTVMAHQGDALDYENMVPTQEHASRLEALLDRPVQWIDDVAGPEARRRISLLEPGEILLLDNVRIYGEELTTFERDVDLAAMDMTSTYLVRHLAPLFDLFVNDAFATAHRAAPSMLAFPQLMPSAAGLLVVRELEDLRQLLEHPATPTIFALGGLKVSDGFAVMGRVLREGVADTVLTAGVLGEIFLLAEDVRLGRPTERFLDERDLLRFVEEAKQLLRRHRDRISIPVDVAVVGSGRRMELPVSALPVDHPILDIGEDTIGAYEAHIASAGTVFANGPAGAYEVSGADEGTRRLWRALATTAGTTVIGGGDTVTSATKFVDLAAIDLVSSAGGALIRFIAGQRLPLLESFATTRDERP